MNFLKKHWLFFIVLIIATFFRLYNLSSVPPGLYPDEAMNGNNALEAISTDSYKIFYPENNGREGLFINFQALLLKIFGTSEPWVLRLASAIFGIITVLGIYLLLYQILKRNDKETNDQIQQKTPLFSKEKLIPFFGAFFTAISFWHINFSRIGFRANMAPALLALGLGILTIALSKLEKKWSWMIYSSLAGIIYGIGMHSYIAYRATPFIVILFFITFWKIFKINIKKTILSFILFSYFAFMAFLPLGIYFIKNPQDFLGRTSQLSVFSSASPIKDLSINIAKTLGMFNLSGDYNWRHNFSGSPQLYWPVGILFLLGTAIGIKNIFKKNPNDNQENKGERVIFLTSIVWMAISFLPVIISNEGIPHALRSILMIPPAFMLAGLGAFYLFSFLTKKIDKKIVYLFFVIIVLGLTIQSYGKYFISWANNPNTKDAFAVKYVELGNEINKISPNIKKFIIVNANGTDVRGIPMPSQTIMFITDTFTPKKQKEKNIFYVLPDQEKNIPKDSLVFYLETK